MSDPTKPFIFTPVTEGVSPLGKQRLVAGDVRFLKTYFVVPAYYTLISQSNYVRRLLFQYNLSFPSDFYITNIAQASGQALVTDGTLSIKYRIGTTVYRYVLIGPNQNLGAQYTSQLIKSNFCLEFRSASTSILAKGIQSPITFQISPISRPFTPGFDSDTVYSISTDNILLKTDFGVTLPETLPYAQDNLAWLTN